MASVVYYVGSEAEAGHHAKPLLPHLPIEVAPPEVVADRAAPGDLAIFFNEYHPPMRDACRSLVAAGIPTLYAIDGISEWRNLWDGGSEAGVMRPALSHKVAAIGRSQARLLESWGNIGKCEVVGVPRFDALLGRTPRRRGPNEPFTLLVMTAKNPAFSRDQREAVVEGLRDLDRWLRTNPSIGGAAVRPIWRLTRSFARRVDVENQLTDLTGLELARALETADAVITTPSTSMLEGMLQGVPVALLDYTNSPHYVPAAWCITAERQIGAVLHALVSPPAERMLLQDTVLHDSLECRGPATPRLVELVERMLERARDLRSRGENLAFPPRLLADPQHGHHLPEPRFELSKLYPAHADFGDLEGFELRAELAYRTAHLERVMAHHRSQIHRLEKRPWNRLRARFRNRRP